MTSSRTWWAQAFADQAKSDLRVFEVLERTTVSSSHRLHYLQMWLEKLCKAYLWLPGGAADDLLRSHNVVGKILPQMIMRYWRDIGFAHRPPIARVRDVCREIDLLHPQVDEAGARPDNVEYPWTGPQDTTVQVPAMWKFRIADELYGPVGKLVRKAAVSLTETPIFL